MKKELKQYKKPNRRVNPTGISHGSRGGSVLSSREMCVAIWSLLDLLLPWMLHLPIDTIYSILQQQLQTKS